MDVMQIFMFLFGMIGVILILVGVVVTMAHSKKRKRCSREITGVISTQRICYDADTIHKTRSAIYEYEYNGKTYHKNSFVSTNSSVEFGKEVKVLVNPDKPEECIVENWVGILASCLFIGIGCVFLALAVLVLILM